MQNRLKKLRLEERLTLSDVQAKTNIDFSILENFEKGLENGIPNSLAIWQKLANFLEVPIEYLMGLNDDSKPLTAWTQKGRRLIYDILKENDVLPLIEREDIA